MEEFPLIVPSLLALLEDLSFSVRERGQAVLADFLAACPHDTIVRAGLLDLFRDVCALGMTYYPPLVSIDESERLITISFSNAITLCEIEAAESHTDRVKLLLPILRDGLLSGYALNSDRPQLIVVLNLCVSRIVDLVGLPVTRYLKVGMTLGCVYAHHHTDYAWEHQQYAHKSICSSFAVASGLDTGSADTAHASLSAAYSIPLGRDLGGSDHLLDEHCTGRGAAGSKGQAVFGRRDFERRGR